MSPGIATMDTVGAIGYGFTWTREMELNGFPVQEILWKFPLPLEGVLQ
nr:hypothetical protein [Desulforamulus aquiferis]